MPVTLSAPSGKTVTVEASTVDGTAEGGRDCTALVSDSIVGLLLAPGGGPLGTLSAEVNPLGHDFSVFTSRSTIAHGLEAPLTHAHAPFGDTPVSGASPRLDVWMRLAGAGSFTDNSDGSLWLGHAGAHYRVNDDLLVGVMGQFDHASQQENNGPGTVDGWGWMAGPYLVARAPGQSLTFDGRVLWGRSHNQISPLGTFEDAFDTTACWSGAGCRGIIGGMR
ncbi:MAG: autotransporter domain-containing protein [Roseitalea sp.]|jgi:hypothetical protein|nr:autotransporter domain-containing protein [Roseitalea sp.]MBO6720820.1 autotransporter domain-containing protein [Roseitalea sp.]MBO6743967.1 autotransporter domain-containing protein [Roseitalea sp.]